MPRMDGVEATRRIMAEAPCPIVIVTSSVNGHMNQVYAAMNLGALDVIDTPALGPRGELQGASGLLDKIATIGMLIALLDAASAAALASTPEPRARSPASPRSSLLGCASTGGPAALGAVLEALPKQSDFCVIIIQHLDSIFASDLAHWLGVRSGHALALAADGDEPAPGRWLLAGTDDHLVMGAEGRLGYTAGEPKAPELSSVGRRILRERRRPLVHAWRRRPADRDGTRRRRRTEKAPPARLAHHRPG